MTTEVAIVGIGMHEFGRTEGVSGMDQGVIAVRRALRRRWSVVGRHPVRIWRLGSLLGQQTPWCPSSDSPVCSSSTWPTVVPRVARRCSRHTTRFVRESFDLGIADRLRQA